MESTALVCPRHKVETPLTCVTCGTPICPKCYVRTPVGLRCPNCAAGVTVKIGGRRRWPIAVAAAAVVVVLGAVVLLTRVSGSKTDQRVGDAAAPAGTNADNGGAAPGYRLISHPAQGYSVEVPTQWQAAGDNSDTTLAYNDPRPTEGALRVSVSRADASPADVVARLIEQLVPQGGQDFSQTPTQISGEPAIKLDYRFPSTPTPGSVMASRTSYIVVHNGNLYSFQLSTVDPAGKGLVFAYMASKFTLL